MKCPKCGDKDAEEIPLFNFTSVLCPNQSCVHFDMDQAVKVVGKAFGVPDHEWEFPEDPRHYLPGDIGMTD